MALRISFDNEDVARFWAMIFKSEFKKAGVRWTENTIEVTVPEERPTMRDEVIAYATGLPIVTAVAA